LAAIVVMAGGGVGGFGDCAAELWMEDRHFDTTYSPDYLK